MHTNVHCNIIYSSQDMETIQVSIDRWVVKKDVVDLYSGVLLRYKNNEILPLAATWMDLEDITKYNKSDIERQI